MSAPRWSVPSATRDGITHTVTEDAETGQRHCNCEASDHPRTRGRCWHIRAVAAGLAGKPRIRVSQRPTPAPLPSFTCARTSAEGQAFVTLLDV
jgi:hypothetical protein